jgi:hypothetical protein
MPVAVVTILLTEAQRRRRRPLRTYQPKTYLLLYRKKLRKNQDLHTTISPKSITAFFLTCRQRKERKATKIATMPVAVVTNLLTEAQRHRRRPVRTYQPKTYLLLYRKKLRKNQDLHTTISPKSITAFFLTCRQRMVRHGN